MSGYIGSADYRHGTTEKIGVLLVNLGTPQAPTAAALRRYLKQFLSDGRVIETPKWLWWFILRLAVLPFRAKKSAAAYSQVWTDAGSPLLVISKKQCAALQKYFADSNSANSDSPVTVALAMSYGEPSVETALAELAQKNCAYLLVLPMYPQYAASTVGSVWDATTAALRRRRFIPHFRFISHYGDDPRYIDALAESIAAHRHQHGGAQKLLFSFHGTPVQMLTAGDPYHCHCHKTARLTAEKLNLQTDEWQVAFQSRFGRAVWLQPYTDATLAQWAADGIKSVQVVCPAFAADCLETLEEIAVENRDIFLQAGGKQYDYIPALNDNPAHINFLRALIDDAIGDWRQRHHHQQQQRHTQATAYQKLRDAHNYYAKEQR